jgi:hypothetical protein
VQVIEATLATSVPTWLEVALNGPWGARIQPGIPMSEADIIHQGVACVGEGAAIVHVHAYDPASGRQEDNWKRYARIIEGIRAQADVIVYPTIAFSGAASDGAGLDARQRFAHTEALAARGLLEWSVVDPGSVNIVTDEEVQADLPGMLYEHPDAHIRRGMELAGRHGFHPGFAIYEPGFLRAAGIAATGPGAAQGRRRPVGRRAASTSPCSRSQWSASPASFSNHALALPSRKL